MRHNEFGQPIGDVVPGFSPGERLGHPALQAFRRSGCRPPGNADDSYAFHVAGGEAADWTCLPGRWPTDSPAGAAERLRRADPCAFVIIEEGAWSWVSLLMRDRSANRVIEVGPSLIPDRLSARAWPPEAPAVLLAQYVPSKWPPL